MGLDLELQPAFDDRPQGHGRDDRDGHRDGRRGVRDDDGDRAGLPGALVVERLDENAILLRKGATSETVSGVLRSQLPLIEALPQVARASNGHVLASPELVVIIALPRQSDDQPANVPVRGVGPLAYEVRNSLTFVEGRRFTPGTREINVGKQATVRFKGLTLGSEVKFGGAVWKVVGVFTADDASFESEVWGDVDLMMPAFQRDGYQSVTVKLTDPLGLRIVQRRDCRRPTARSQAAPRARLLRGAVARPPAR